MPDETTENTLGSAQANIITAIIDGSMTARLLPTQTAILMERLGRAIRLIPEELRGQALDPNLFEGVARNLTPRA